MVDPATRRDAVLRYGEGARLSARLLGRIEIAIDDRPVRIAGRQAQALVALLVLVRRVRSRDAVAADLWPEATSATGSLRQALWLLRSSLGAAGVDPDRILETDADAIGLAAHLRVDSDVDRFSEALVSTPANPDLAVALYRGELAECLGHECFARERERLADAYEDALLLVAQRRLEDEEIGSAREAALSLIARDPLREEAHVTLIRAYAVDGSRSQILRQYRRVCDLLRRELDVEPLPETVAAFRGALRAAEDRSAALVRETLRETRLVAVGPGRHVGSVARVS